MSRLEALLRLSLVREELIAVASQIDDECLREIIEYVARLLAAKVK